MIRQRESGSANAPQHAHDREHPLEPGARAVTEKSEHALHMVDEVHTGYPMGSPGKRCTATRAFPSAAMSSIENDFRIPAFQSNQIPPEKESVESRHEMIEEHLPRVSMCKVVCSEVCTKGTLPPLHGLETSHLDGTSFQSLGMPIRAVTTSTFRELLQCVTPFNTDDATSFVHDWSAARPTARPSACSSHLISTLSSDSSLLGRFHETCDRQAESESSSERLAAQFHSTSDCNIIGSFSDFRSVVDDLEDLNHARGSVHGSESMQSDPERHSDCSERHDCGSHSNSEIAGAASSWQLQSENAAAATDSTEEADLAPQVRELNCRYQAQLVHLSQSLGASSIYVQQLQELQYRMEQHIQQNQLEISGLRCALADAHCKIAAQHSELESLRSVYQLAAALHFPCAPPPPPPPPPPATHPTEMHHRTASKETVESINSCIGGPVHGSRVPAAHDVTRGLPVWNPVFSIEGSLCHAQSSRDTSASTFSASVLPSAGCTNTSSTNSSNVSACGRVVDPMLPNELQDTSDSLRASSRNDGSFTSSLQQAESTGAPSGKRVSESSVPCGALRGMATHRPTHANSSSVSTDLCVGGSIALQGQHEITGTPCGEVQPQSRLKAAMQLLRETVREAQVLYAPREPPGQPPSRHNYTSSDDVCVSAASMPLVHVSHSLNSQDPNNGTISKQSSSAPHAWATLLNIFWLVGSFVGLACIVYRAVHAACDYIGAGTNVSNNNVAAEVAQLRLVNDEPHASQDASFLTAPCGDIGRGSAQATTQSLPEGGASFTSEGDTSTAEDEQCFHSIPALPVSCAAFMLLAEDAAGVDDAELKNDDPFEDTDVLYGTLDQTSDQDIELPVSAAARSTSRLLPCHSFEDVSEVLAPVDAARTSVPGTFVDTCPTLPAAASSSCSKQAAVETTALQFSLLDFRLQPDLAMALDTTNTEASHVFEVDVSVWNTAEVFHASAQQQSSFEASTHQLDKAIPSSASESSGIEDSSHSDYLSTSSTASDAEFAGSHEALLQTAGSDAAVCNEVLPYTPSTASSQFQSCCSDAELSTADSSTDEETVGKVDTAASREIEAVACCAFAPHHSVCSHEAVGTTTIGSPAEGQKAGPLEELSLESVQEVEQGLQREPSVAEWGSVPKVCDVNNVASRDISNADESAASPVQLPVGTADDSLCSTSSLVVDVPDVALRPGCFEDCEADAFEVHACAGSPQHLHTEVLCSGEATENQCSWGADVEADQIENEAPPAVLMSRVPNPGAIDIYDRMWFGAPLAADSRVPSPSIAEPALFQPRGSGSDAESDCAWLCSPAGVQARGMFARRFRTWRTVSDDSNGQTEAQRNETHQETRVSLGYSIRDWFDHASAELEGHDGLYEDAWLAHLQPPVTSSHSTAPVALRSAEAPQNADVHDELLCALIAAGMHVHPHTRTHNPFPDSPSALQRIGGENHAHHGAFHPAGGAATDFVSPEGAVGAVSVQSELLREPVLAAPSCDVDAPKLVLKDCVLEAAAEPLSTKPPSEGLKEEDTMVGSSVLHASPAVVTRADTPRPLLPQYSDHCTTADTTDAVECLRSRAAPSHGNLPWMRVPVGTVPEATGAKASVICFLTHGHHYAWEMSHLRSANPACDAAKVVVTETAEEATPAAVGLPGREQLACSDNITTLAPPVAAPAPAPSAVVSGPTSPVDHSEPVVPHSNSSSSSSSSSSNGEDPLQQHTQRHIWCPPQRVARWPRVISPGSTGPHYYSPHHLIVADRFVPGALPTRRAPDAPATPPHSTSLPLGVARYPLPVARAATLGTPAPLQIAPSSTALYQAPKTEPMSSCDVSVAQKAYNDGLCMAVVDEGSASAATAPMLGVANLTAHLPNVSGCSNSGNNERARLEGSDAATEPPIINAPDQHVAVEEKADSSSRGGLPTQGSECVIQDGMDRVDDGASTFELPSALPSYSDGGGAAPGPLSSPHRLLMHSLQRHGVHRKGATAATNSPSKTFASRLGEKAGEETRHRGTLQAPGHLEATSADAALRAQPLHTPVATDPTRQCLGEPRHLSSFLIRSNLAAARRAFRNMRDNEQ